MSVPPSGPVGAGQPEASGQPDVSPYGRPLEGPLEEPSLQPGDGGARVQGPQPERGYPGFNSPGPQRPGMGHPTPGYPPSGYPAQGYPTPGYPPSGYPAQGHPGRGYPMPGHPMGRPVQVSQNALAGWALGAGIAGFFFCGLPSIAAIILGAFSRKAAGEGRATNGGMGTTGMVLGIVGVVLWGLIFFGPPLALLLPGLGGYYF